jgi:hypothetical protein
MRTVIAAAMCVQPNDVTHSLQCGLQMPELLASSAPVSTPEEMLPKKERMTKTY